MAVMPGAVHRPISYKGVPRMARYDVLCFHTIVGHDPAPAAHWSIGSRGEITQSRDTLYQSAANAAGNPRVLAVECEDLGEEFGTWDTRNGHAVPSFTPEQIEAGARIAAWAYQVHGIPLQRCPDSRPGSRGIGYHRLGIPGNWGDYAYSGLVAGGEVWTTKPGKACPGDRRITQIINEIIPRARALAGLYKQEGNDMAGQYSRELAPSGYDPATGQLEAVETSIPIDKDGAAGMTKVWVTLFAHNTPEAMGMRLRYCHWRINAGGGHTTLVPMVPDGTEIAPLGYVNAEAPKGAVALVVDHESLHGGSVCVAWS